MVEARKAARSVCPRCVVGYFVSNAMPDPDRFCTNCGYREPRPDEAKFDFVKYFGR